MIGIRSAFLLRSAGHTCVVRQASTSGKKSPSDPVQKLFLDKLHEFNKSNRGLDEKSKKILNDEMLRLKRVYKVDNEAKIADIDHKFPKTADVVLGAMPEAAKAQ